MESGCGRLPAACRCRLPPPASRAHRPPTSHAGIRTSSESRLASLGWGLPLALKGRATAIATTLTVDDPPQLLGSQHHVDVADPKRVGRRGDDRRRRAERSSLTNTL